MIGEKPRYSVNVSSIIAAAATPSGNAAPRSAAPWPLSSLSGMPPLRFVVFERGGEVFANSRDVAASFGKQHRNVLQAIDNLLRQHDNLRLRNFQQSQITVATPTGGAREHRTFDMNRDGFTLLVMGFTGKRALDWKLRYIDAFNAMEAELRNRAPREDDMLRALNGPATVRGREGGAAIDNLLKQNKKLRLLNFEESVSERANPSGGAAIFTQRNFAPSWARG